MAQSHFTPDPPRARNPSRRRSPEHPQNPPAEPPSVPAFHVPGPPAPSRPARDLSAPGHPRDTESPRSFRPIPVDHDPPLMIFTPRVLPGTHTQRTKPSHAKRVSTPLCQPQPKEPGAVPRSRSQPTREAGHRREEGHRRAPPQKANGEHHPPQGAAGGSGGSSPRESTASHWRGAEKPRA